MGKISKLTFIILCSVNFNCGNIKGKAVHCDIGKADSSFLKLAQDFTPDKIGLDKCLPGSLDIDTNCLRSLPHYKYAVLLILVKLYDHHIQVAHQGYDLYSMRSGAAKTIIDEFDIIGGYNKRRLEMLNSGTVLDVIDKEPALRNDPLIKKYYERIHAAIKHGY